MAKAGTDRDKHAIQKVYSMSMYERIWHVDRSIISVEVIFSKACMVWGEVTEGGGI